LKIVVHIRFSGEGRRRSAPERMEKREPSGGASLGIRHFHSILTGKPNNLNVAGADPE